MKQMLFPLLLAFGCLATPLSGATFGPVNAATNDLPPQGMGTRPEKDPLRTLDDLIALTEKSLAEQKKLRRQLVDYYTAKSRYLQDQQNRDSIIQMIKVAHQVQQTIETQHLAYVVDTELLDELRFFAQIASKKGITRP